MWTVISSILLGLVIAVPVYILLSHFKSGRKENLLTLILSFISFGCTVSALLLILLFSQGQDLAAMIAMFLLIAASITSVLIVLVKLFLYIKMKRKK